MKVLKVFAFFLFVFAVLIGAAFVLIPHERILNQALERIEATTGRKIEVIGGSQITLFPNLGVVARDIRVSEGDDPSPLRHVTADELIVSVKTMALLGRKIELNRVVLDGADIVITSNASQESQSSISQAAEEGGEDAAHSSPSEAASLIENLSFEAIELTNSKFRFTTGDKTYELSDLNAQVLPIQGTDGLDLELDSVYKNQRFELQLEVPSLKNVLESGGSISGTIDTEFASFSALAENPLSDAVGAEIEANIENMAELLSVLDLSSSSWPKELGNTLNVSTKVMFSEDIIKADDLLLGFLDNRITGQLQAILSEAPALSGALNLGTFSYGATNVEGQAQSSSASRNSQAPSGLQGWSDAPIALPDLNFVNANVDIKAQSLAYGPYSLSDVASNVTLENGVLRANIERATAFGGALNGQFRVQGGSAQSFAGEVKGTGLRVEQLLKTFANRDEVKGTLSAQASFTTAGQSVAQFMKNLGGEGQFNISEGRYDGIDLDQVFRSGQVQSGTTLFDKASASYAINAGVLLNSDLLVTIPDGELRGEGAINLGSQSLDYVLTPKSLNARDGKSLAIPVRLKGPWSDLKILPDLEAALQQNLEREIKEAEQKLKDRVKEEAAKKLGVTLKEDQSLEDAVKEKAEQVVQEKVEEQLKGKIEKELSNGLKNLFGGN